MIGVAILYTIKLLKSHWKQKAWDCQSVCIWKATEMYYIKELQVFLAKVVDRNLPY